MPNLFYSFFYQKITKTSFANRTIFVLPTADGGLWPPVWLIVNNFPYFTAIAINFWNESAHIFTPFHRDHRPLPSPSPESRFRSAMPLARQINKCAWFASQHVTEIRFKINFSNEINGIAFLHFLFVFINLFNFFFPHSFSLSRWLYHVYSIRSVWIRCFFDVQCRVGMH